MRTVRTMSLLLLLLSLAMALFASGQAPAETKKVAALGPADPYTFSFLWPFDGGPKWPGSPIADEVTAKTGVTVKIVSTKGDWAEFHNLLIASGDFPDMVTMDQGSELQRYLDAQALVKLDDIMPKYAPSFYQMLSSSDNSNLTEVYKRMGRGSLRFWGMANSLIFKGQPKVDDPLHTDPYYMSYIPDSHSGLLLYPEIGQLTDKKPQTLDDLYTVFNAYKKKFGGDGMHYAVGTYSTDGSNHVQSALTFNGYYLENDGLMVSWTDDNKTYRAGFFEPVVLDYLLWLNKLYTEGLMDPEAPIQTEDNAAAKFNGARYFAKVGGWWLVHTANAAFPEVKDLQEHIYIPLKITAQKGGKYRGVNVSSIGWRMTGITNKAQRPEKILQFMEWAYTAPGAWMLMNWGFQGKDYIMTSKGQPDINDEIAKTHTGDYYYELGLSAGDTYPWVWPFLPDPSRTVEGFPPSAMMADFYMKGAASDLRDRGVSGGPFNWHYDYTGTWWADSTLKGLTIPEDLMVKWGNANALLEDVVNKMIMAKTSVDAKAIYTEAVARMKSLGAQDYIDYLNKNFPQKK